MIESFINKNIRKIYLLARYIYTFIPRHFLKGYSFPPLSVVILLTYRCNCRCKHCFYYNEINKKETEDTQKKELSKEELLDLISQCSKLGVKNITFHGGEPFLRLELIELIRYAKSKGIRTNITSNAALIDGKKAEEIVLSGLNNLCVSMDGPEKIHDLIRGKGTFKKTINAIKLINEFKSKHNKSTPAINLACTITSINLNYLSEILEIFKGIKINAIQFTGLTWNSRQNLELSKIILKDFKKENVEAGSELMPDKLAGINEEILLREREKIKNLAEKYSIAVYFPPFSSKETIKSYYSDDKFSFKKSCNYPWASTVISPGGYVYACIPLSFLSMNFGNIKHSSLKQIWNSEEYKKFRKLIFKNKKLPLCNKCCEMDPSNRLG